MSYRDFTFPEVQKHFGLSLTESALFPTVAAIDLSEEFLDRMREGAELALLTSTEKARSEFIIAPVLLELRRRLRPRFGLFSGVEFNVDSSRELNGFCDFILTRSPLQSSITAPVVAIVEAKNDNLRSGLGQCIAAMVAAREFNLTTKSDLANEAVYGAVTTGSLWRFLQLAKDALTIDSREYNLSELSKIMGILASILTATPSESP
jgi:hypothetical protein